MTVRTPVILLVDDLRSFVDGRAAEVARNSAAGVELLDRHRDLRVDELWLDHDLGDDDTIWPVVEVLERAAFESRPFDVGVVVIHSANPAGAAKMAQFMTQSTLLPSDPVLYSSWDGSSSFGSGCCVSRGSPDHVAAVG